MSKTYRRTAYPVSKTNSDKQRKRTDRLSGSLALDSSTTGDDGEDVGLGWRNPVSQGRKERRRAKRNVSKARRQVARKEEREGKHDHSSGVL